MGKKIYWATIIIFSMLIFWQHHYVYMYFDDYGYASLSYIAFDNPLGMAYGISEIFHFLQEHYLHWGGRVVYFFFEIIIFRIGGLKLMQAVQSVIIIAICILSGKIVAEVTDEDSCKCVSLSMIVYGLFQLKTLKDGIYWYTASVLYTWPMLPLFGSIYVYLMDKKRESKLKKILCIILVFLAAASQEQIAVLTIVFYLLLFLFEHLGQRHQAGKKSSIIWYIGGICISACAGGAVILLAPGNIERAHSELYQGFYSKNFLARTIVNIGWIINGNVGFHNWVFVFVLTVFCGAAAAICFESRKIITAMFVFILCFLIIPFTPIPKELGLITGTVWIAVFCPVFLLYYIRRKEYFLLILLIAGICSQAMMAVSPAIPLRIHTMFEFILHILLVDCIVWLERAVNSDIKKSIMLKRSILMLILYAVCNFMVVMAGYKSNYAIHRNNNQALIQARNKIQAGETVDEVLLYRLRNDSYANMMPYQEGFAYIEQWMKKYYEIPHEVEFRYK